MSEAVVWLTIFVLSIFVGIEVISKVSSTLHTPLMSGANAIHGVILLGAIIVTGSTDNGLALTVGLIAIVLAAINMVGGFVVTDRMLQMFVRKKPEAGRRRGGRQVTIPVWAQLAYLAAAVCFILALKGLSGPKTARNGNLIGAVAAVVACAIPFFYLDLDHVPLILAAIAVGTVVGVYGARTVQMTQMPQMVALFNGVGGGAAALVALLELHEVIGASADEGWFTLLATAFTIVVGSVSLLRLDRHLRQAAGPDDLPAGGLPRPAGRLRRVAARSRRAQRAARPRADDVGRRRAGRGRAARRRPAGAAGRRRRRTDRDLAAQRLHRPDRRRRWLRAGQHPAAGGRHARRRLRHVPHPADGRRDGPLGRQHPVRRAQGRLDPRRRRGVRPAGPERRARGRRDPARRTPSG